MPEQISFNEAANAYNEMLGVGKPTEVEAQPAPTAEQPVEPVTPQEPPVTPQETPPAEAPPAPVVDDWFDISKINSRLEYEFKDENDLKEKIRSLKENEEYLKKKDYYSELDKLVQEYQNQFSDESLIKTFGSKENFDRHVILQTLSQSMPPSIAAAVVGTDLSKVDNLHAMYLEAVARDPNLLAVADEPTIKKGLLKRVGVDISDPEFDLAKYQDAAKVNPDAMIGLSMGATNAKSFMKGLMDEAAKNIPVQKDFKQEFEQRVSEQRATIQKRTDSWATKAKEMAEQFKEFKIMEKDAQGNDVVDFTFAVPKEFSDSLANYVVNYAVQNGMDVTPETVANIQSEIQDAFEDRYKRQILKAYTEEKVAKVKADLDNKIHNNRPISTQEAPEGHVNQYEEELKKQRQFFGLT